MKLLYTLQASSEAFFTQRLVKNSTLVLARLLAAFIFIGAGFSKLGAGYAGTQGYMQSMGIPGELLPLVIALEIGGGLALVLGFQTRLVAFALAIFSLLSGFIFHGGAEMTQQIMLMKNISMSGGLLSFAIWGAGCWSIDSLLQKKYRKV